MMSQAASPWWVERAIVEYRGGRPLVLLFDYDGTLTPIVRHPSLAVLGSATRDALGRLMRLLGVSPGVLSGRPLNDVKERVGLPLPYFAGSGGLELELGGTRRLYSGGSALQSIYTAVHERLIEPLRRHPGTWVERKPASLAIHFRGLLPLNAVAVRADVTRVLDEYPQVRGRETVEVIEVTPAGGWDKGTAVAEVLAHLRTTDGGDPLVVYFSSSPQAEEGMVAVGKVGGIVISVGGNLPIADERIVDANELTAQLHDLHNELTLITPTIDSPGVLVIDPDDAHRRHLREGLQRMGWQVWACESGEEAHQLLEMNAGPVVAVVVDLELPGLLGARLLSSWEKTHPHLHRCGMAAVSPYMAAAFQRMNDTPLFRKPVTLDDFDRHLREALSTAVVG